MPSKKQDKQTNEKINNMILNRNQFAFGFMNLKVHRHLLFDPVVSYLSIFFPSTSWKAYCQSHKFVSEQNSSTYKKSLYLQGSRDPQCKGKEEAGEVSGTGKYYRQAAWFTGNNIMYITNFVFIFPFISEKCTEHMETQTHTTGDCIFKEEKIS